MIRLLGMLCILAGGAGTGISLAKELEMRIRELTEIQKLMLLLKGEIRYIHRPLPEVFRHLSDRASAPFRDFFSCTAEELQERRGRTAEEIWEKNLCQYLNGLHISRQERMDFEKLGSMLGQLDVEMQMNTLDYYLEQLKQSVSEASKQAKGQGRIYRYLGVLGGAALVILIF